MKTQTLEQLNQIHSDLFKLANSLAGEETGHLAGSLHQAANIVSRVEQQLEGTEQPTGMLDIVDLSPDSRMNIALADYLNERG